MWRSLLTVLPTWCLLAALGVLGWYGHRTGWVLPTFASLRGEVRPVDDWCREHSVPEAICVECRPELLPRNNRGWCAVHGVHECTLCFPEGAQLLRKTTVLPADRQRAEQALAFAPRPANSAICKLSQRRIQFVDERAVEKAAIEVEAAWRSPVMEFIAVQGTLGYDQTRVAHLASRSTGTVWKVFKHLGQEVLPGDVLALVEAADVGKAKAEVLQSFATLHVKTKTLASVKESGGAVPVARVREIEAEVQEAEIRLAAGCQALTNLGLILHERELQAVTLDQLKAKLQFLGLPAALVATLDPKKVTSNLLPLLAPMEGVVLSRDVVPGEVVDATKILFEVVATQHLWLTLDVPSEEAPRVRVGQKVQFKPDNSREQLTGHVAWRSPQVDPKTRTVKVRVDVLDAERKLFANSFGAGRIVLREEAHAVVVPNDAVHWEGCCHVVFVRDKHYLQAEAPKVFHTRTVRLGAIDGGNTEIIAGLLPGELVAVKNSGVLKAELLRGNLGEG